MYEIYQAQEHVHRDLSAEHRGLPVTVVHVAIVNVCVCALCALCMFRILRTLKFLQEDMGRPGKAPRQERSKCGRHQKVPCDFALRNGHSGTTCVITAILLAWEEVEHHYV